MDGEILISVHNMFFVPSGEKNPMFAYQTTDIFDDGYSVPRYKLDFFDFFRGVPNK